MEGDLIDYEDDGYVAPNMSYVPEGLDEHDVTGGGGAAANKSGNNEEDILLKGEGEDDGEEEAGEDSFEVSYSTQSSSCPTVAVSLTTAVNHATYVGQGVWPSLVYAAKTRNML